MLQEQELPATISRPAVPTDLETRQAAALQSTNLFSRLAVRAQRDLDSNTYADEPAAATQLRDAVSLLRCLAAGVREIHNDRRGKLFDIDRAGHGQAVNETAESQAAQNNERLNMEGQDAYQFVISVFERALVSAMLEVATFPIEPLDRHNIAARINASPLWQSLTMLGQDQYQPHPAAVALRQAIRDWLAAEPFVVSELSTTVQFNPEPGAEKFHEDYLRDLGLTRGLVAKDQLDSGVTTTSRRLKDEIGQAVEAWEKTPERMEEIVFPYSEMDAIFDHVVEKHGGDISKVNHPGRSIKFGNAELAKFNQQMDQLNELFQRASATVIAEAQQADGQQTEEQLDEVQQAT